MWFLSVRRPLVFLKLGSSISWRTFMLPIVTNRACLISRQSEQMHVIFSIISVKEMTQKVNIFQIIFTTKFALLLFANPIFPVSSWSGFSVQSGAIQRGAMGAVALPTTYESNFIHHDFVQFGKQNSQYKANFPFTVLSQQFCEVCFISCNSESVMRRDNQILL